MTKPHMPVTVKFTQSVQRADANKDDVFIIFYARPPILF